MQMLVYAIRNQHIILILNVKSISTRAYTQLLSVTRNFILPEMEPEGLKGIETLLCFLPKRAYMNENKKVLKSSKCC